MFKQCVLAGLILGVMAPAVYADSTTKNIYESIKANSFFADSKADFYTLNMFKYLNSEEKDRKDIATSWGQGLALNYKSGYLWDTIGFDASYYGAIKLAASKDFHGRAMLARNEKGNATGFNKIGQRYLKVKVGDNKRGVDLKYGWQELSRFGGVTRSYQLTPNTYLGVTGDAHFDAFRLRAGYLTSNIQRNDKKKEPFEQLDKKVIDHVITGDLHYNGAIIQANYLYANAENYMERHGLELAYVINKSWKLHAKAYNSHALSNYKAITADKPFDNNAWHYTVEGEWRQNDWYTRLGLAYTDADGYNGKLGSFPRHFARNMRGNMNTGVLAGRHYMRDGEKAINGDVAYQIHPDLNIGIYAVYGQFDYKNETYRNGETSLYAVWKPKDEALKNWSARTKFGPGWSYKNKSLYIPTDDKRQRAHSWSTEFVVEYRFNVL